VISARIAAIVALALLAACGTAHRRGAPAPETLGGPVCRVGPDGGPPLADRGIGGTGAIADRGIGGTGIIGVITGFASICVDGLEIGTDAAVPVLVDGDAVSGAALRTGQFVAIDAVGGDATLHARRIRVRYEVSGPVDAVATDGSLTVAGQRVVVTGRIWGQKPKVGDWVRVSGLHGPSGEIVATRVDLSAPGPVTVHGRLVSDGKGLAIGALRVRAISAQAAALTGNLVAATGRLDHGVLIANSVTPDLLATNPAAAFDAGVQQFVIEGYAQLTSKGLQLGAGFSAAARPGLDGAPGWAIVKLQRRGDEPLLATSLVGVAPAGPAPMSPPSGTVPPAPDSGAAAPAGRPGPEGQPRGEPAPIPDRGLLQGNGSGGAGSGRFGFPGGAGPPAGNLPGAGSGPSAGGMPGAGPSGMGGPGPGPHNR
jgi:hypothetical protein